jgi:hypothetical protein
VIECNRSPAKIAVRFSVPEALCRHLHHEAVRGAAACCFSGRIPMEKPVLPGVEFFLKKVLFPVDTFCPLSHII